MSKIFKFLGISYLSKKQLRTIFKCPLTEIVLGHLSKCYDELPQGGTLSTGQHSVINRPRVAGAVLHTPS